jgi:glycosyltransferase involved in cell wall biosynthesis
MSPRVSVIVPLYNKGRYIGRCLDSILAQTFRDFEVIVVDDGSTDDGPDVVRAYAQRDARVRLIRQPNAGPGAARNRAAEEACADLLAPLDADDAWEPDYLAESERLLSVHGEHVATITHAIRIEPGEESSGKFWRKPYIPEGCYRVTQQSSPKLIAALLPRMFNPATVIRKDAFWDAGGYYAKDRCLFGEDTYLWLNILMRYEVSFSVRPLVVRHLDSSELGVNWKGVRPIEPFLVNEIDLTAKCPPEYRDLLRKILALRACKTASVYGYFGRPAEARRLVRKFLTLSDWRLPWFFVALVSCTPVAKWVGALTRLAHINLRTPHVQ